MTEGDSMGPQAAPESPAGTSIPAGWLMKGTGSAVDRPLVYFHSDRLDAEEDSYVQVEVGNSYGLPTASVMVVAQAPTPIDKIDFPDRLWRAVAVAPALPAGVTDASTRARGAQGRAGADAKRNNVPAAWSRGFSQSGWHGRGPTLRHVNGDYAALLPARDPAGHRTVRDRKAGSFAS